MDDNIIIYLKKMRFGDFLRFVFKMKVAWSLLFFIVSISFLLIGMLFNWSLELNIKKNGQPVRMITVGKSNI